MAGVLDQVCMCRLAVLLGLLGYVSYTSAFTTNYVSSRKFVILPHTYNPAAHFLVIMMMIISLTGRHWYSFVKHNLFIILKHINPVTFK
jgi:hypothetical protein